jgi:mono/diheme cytochrome c family protein
VAYSVADAPALINPVASTAATLQRGQVLYQVNCAVCHGATGLGDGPMRDRLTTAGYKNPPANLTTSGSVSSGEGGLAFLIVSKGFAGAYGMPADQFMMPPFEKLLTAEDRWAMIRYLRSIQ